MYRNCGERGVVRHQVPSHNQIVNNIFYYNTYKGWNPAVYLGSRNGSWLIDYCWEDEYTRVWEWDSEGIGEYKYTKIDSNQFGSADSDLDYARHNVIMQNQLYKRKIINSDLKLVSTTPDDLIRTRNPSVNSPNYIQHNQMVTEENAVIVGIDEWAKSLSWLSASGNPRLAGCYTSNEAGNFVLHGQSIDSGNEHYRFMCNDGDFVTYVSAPPKILTPKPGAMISAGSVTLTGEHKGATHHWVWVGTAHGEFDLGKKALGTATSQTVTVPTSRKGKKIYVRYWSRINGALVSTDQAYSVSNWWEATSPQDIQANNTDSEGNPWRQKIPGGSKALNR